MIRLDQVKKVTWLNVFIFLYSCDKVECFFFKLSASITSYQLRGFRVFSTEGQTLLSTKSLYLTEQGKEKISNLIQTFMTSIQILIFMFHPNVLNLKSKQYTLFCFGLKQVVLDMMCNSFQYVSHISLPPANRLVSFYFSLPLQPINTTIIGNIILIQGNLPFMLIIKNV